MKNENLFRLTVTAVMIALASILSLFQLGIWVNGGSVTLLSMLPICIIAYRYGAKWGFLTGAVYGLLQMILGASALRGVTLTTVIGSVFLDYLIAFGVLGFSGLFKRFAYPLPLKLALGTLVAGILRFICHFFSGFLFWGSIINDGFGAMIYSFTYNIGYMAPEIILTVAGALIIGAILPKKLLQG